MHAGETDYTAIMASARASLRNEIADAERRGYAQAERDIVEWLCSEKATQHELWLAELIRQGDHRPKGATTCPTQS